MESWEAIVLAAETSQARVCGIDTAARSGVIGARVILWEESPAYRVRS